MAQDVWLYDFEKHEIERITDWRGTDRHPMWHRDGVYYVSDRTGTLNLYRWDSETRETRQLTDYQDWDIKWPGHGPEAIVFERGGSLYRMGFTDETLIPLAIEIDHRPAARDVDAAKNLQSVALSPDGERVVFGARGEVFVASSKQAEPRNVSRTPASRERDVAWSPDGKRIAFLSDETGTEELYVMTADGEERKQLTEGSRWIIRNPIWSPDGMKIAFHNLDMELFYVDVESGTKTRVDRSRQTFIRDYGWSPDSEWLTYTKLDRVDFASIFLYELSTGKLHRVTNERTWDAESVFDPAGRYLFFIARRDFNPAHGRIEYNFTYNDMDRIYLLTLKADTASPFGPEASGDAAEASSAAVSTEIDLSGLGQRVVGFPISPGSISGLRVVEDVVFYIRRTELDRRAPASLYAYDLNAKKEVKVLEGPEYFDVSPDGMKLLVGLEDRYGVVAARASEIGGEVVEGWRKLELPMRLEPIAEWRQMFGEAWRWQKSLHWYEDEDLYTPDGRVVDWSGIREKYLPLVDRLSDRQDLNYLLAEMLGELEIGHLGARGGDLPKVEPARTGLLGAELSPDAAGYFRIDRILAGENWNPDTRSPLTEPGVNASPGDYLLEINGEPLRLPENPYRLLEKTLGTTVTLKLNTSPSEEGAWTVKLRPIRSEARLRYLEWVESNLRRVEEATDGRVGYVHCPTSERPA